MSLKHLSKTFRFRLAALYCGLTVATLLVSFLASMFLLQKNLDKEIRTVLTRNMMEYTQAYQDFFGRLRYKKGLELELTETSRKKLTALFPGLQIHRLSTRTRKSGKRYHIFGHAGDLLYKIELTDQGNIRKVESMVLQDLLTLTDIELAALGKGSESGPTFTLILSEDLSLIASTRLPDGISQVDLQQIENYIGNPEPAKLPHMSRPHYILSQRLESGRTLCVGLYPQAGLLALQKLRHVFILLLFCLSPISALIGWFVSSRAMAGVQRVRNTAEKIAAGNMSVRVESRHEGLEIEQLAESFNGMIDHIGLLIRELKDVSTNIAHDLRTPVTRIKGMLETVDWSDATPEQQRTAGMIMEECDTLVHMINTMLEISEADAGLMKLNLETIDLAQEVSSAVDLFQALAANKGVTLEAALPPGPVPLAADRARFQRIVANLLDNAVKFTPFGGEVTVLLSSANGERQVAVQDQGIGIAEDDISRVFERFYRADNSRSEPGNGLGLSLTQALVKQHGGTMTLTSQLGKGSTFAITFPQTSNITN